jgi:hypothetical protein
MAFMRSVFLLTARAVPGHPQLYAAGHHTDITRSAVPGQGRAPPLRESRGRLMAAGATGWRHVMSM